MKLTEEQTAAVRTWVEAGNGLSEVQRNLREQFEVSLTYLETRFLVDDLKLTLQSTAPVPQTTNHSLITESPAEGAQPGVLHPASPESPGTGKVRVSLDHLTKPNTLISGKVTFSDGETAEWYLDQLGRLGLVPNKPAYRPADQDILAFQMELQQLARTQGL